MKSRQKKKFGMIENNFDKFANEITHSLADRTGGMAITAMQDGSVWQAGHGNLFAFPEFGNIGACASLFGFMDEDEQLIDLFFNRFPIETVFDVLFTEDMGFRNMPVGIVAAHFNVKERNGALGVIGPVRQSYASLVPTIRYYRSMLEEVMQ